MTEVAARGTGNIGFDGAGDLAGVPKGSANESPPKVGDESVEAKTSAREAEALAGVAQHRLGNQ